MKTSCSVLAVLADAGLCAAAPKDGSYALSGF